MGEIPHCDGSAARTLDLGHCKTAPAALYHHRSLENLHDGSRIEADRGNFLLFSVVKHLRSEDPKLLSVEPGVRDGLRVEGPHLPLDLYGLLRPVDSGLALRDAGCVSRPLLRLRTGCKRAAGEACQRLEQSIRPKRSELPPERPSCMAGQNLQAPLQEHWAGIEPCVQLHDGHTGPAVPSQYGAFDWGGTAPARQKRGVNVQAAQPGEREHLGRHDEPVRDDDQNIGMPALEHAASCRVLESLRLCERKAGGRCGLLYRACRETPATAARPVRLGEDTHDLVAAAQRSERRQRELGRAREGDAQRQYARRAPALADTVRAARSLRSLSSFLRIRSRLRSER